MFYQSLNYNFNSIFFYLAHRTCAQWEFRCNSTGSCIPWSWVCDGEIDCVGGADEYLSQGCHNRPNITCMPDQFQCLSHECIDQVIFYLFNSNHEFFIELELYQFSCIIIIYCICYLLL